MSLLNYVLKAVIYTTNIDGARLERTILQKSSANALHGNFNSNMNNNSYLSGHHFQLRSAHRTSGNTRIRWIIH